MSDEKSLNKSTLGFIAIAAGLVGMLLGFGVSNKDKTTTASKPVVTSATTANAIGALPFRFIADSEFENITKDEFGRAAPYNIGENFQHSEKVFKQQTLEINLALEQTVEYKAVMEQGDAIVYEWSVENGEVYSDFHGHPPSAKEFYTRYAETEGDSNQGAIVAAYDGQHGWFWLNISDNPVTVTLKIAGFFDDVIEVDLNAEDG